MRSRCQHPLDHRKGKKIPEKKKKSASVLLTMPKPLAVWIPTSYKILRDGNMRPSFLLLRNLYACQEATSRTGHGTDCFQIRKGVCQGCLLSPCLFNLYAEYIMLNAGLIEAQAEIKIAGKNISNPRYAVDTTFMAEREDELKILLMSVKEESEKNWLKTQHSKNEDNGIQSHHSMVNKGGNNGNSEKPYCLTIQACYF